MAATTITIPEEGQFASGTRRPMQLNTGVPSLRRMFCSSGIFLDFVDVVQFWSSLYQSFTTARSRRA